MARYNRTAELPDYTKRWEDSTGAVINLTGYTCRLEIFAYRAASPILTKTVGITGAATDPNVTVAWALGELNLTPGAYRLRLTATRPADGKERVLEDVVVITGPPVSTAGAGEPAIDGGGP